MMVRSEVFEPVFSIYVVVDLLLAAAIFLKLDLKL